jgi:hypothetical protein
VQDYSIYCKDILFGCRIIPPFKDKLRLLTLYTPAAGVYSATHFSYISYALVINLFLARIETLRGLWIERGFQRNSAKAIKLDINEF